MINYITDYITNHRENLIFKEIKDTTSHFKTLYDLTRRKGLKEAWEYEKLITQLSHPCWNIYDISQSIDYDYKETKSFQLINDKNTNFKGEIETKEIVWGYNPENSFDKLLERKKLE